MAIRMHRESRRRYHWPELQLNVWIMVVLSGSATCLGIFSWLMAVQAQMHLGTPWYVTNPCPNTHSLSIIGYLESLLCRGLDNQLTQVKTSTKQALPIHGCH